MARMTGERDRRKVIPLFQPDCENGIKQLLSEIYNAIYLLNLATDLDGIGIKEAEIEGTRDELQRDLISLMREIGGYADKASFALLELIKKHGLDYSSSK